MSITMRHCPQTPASNANRASRKAYDRWIKANEKACVFILASMSDVLAKKHESLAMTKEIMDSLKGMFGQPKLSLRHEAIKYIYTKRMKEGTSIREHVLDMMMHFNIAEVNGGAIDEANQVSFILESLPKSFIPFQTNASLTKIEFNLTTILNELQRFQNLTKGKRKEVEANVATTKENLIEDRPLNLNLDYQNSIERLRRRERGRLSGITSIGRLVKSGLLNQLEDNSLPPCDSYLEGQMTKRSFTGKGLRAKTPLELVHSDLCGPMNVKAQGRYEYFISAMNGVDCDQWIKAMDLEMESMYSNSVWTLVDQPSEVRPIGCKWIYKRKRDQADGCQDSLFERYGIHLSKEQCPKTPQEVEDMSNIPYAYVVRSLMYAMLCTRPDICYSVGIVSRYQSNPGRDHWTAVKNILKYLRRTKGYMPVYGSKDLILTGYTDSDFKLIKMLECLHQDQFSL
ncbi:gag/pol protein [Cucumis melo var. makuwa]|uniref:Gag/pol protein n=1 Tax=Cucumis melo var. makuwa TaxID=1194695 RepID=A0A5D3BDN4_CUCMM|nr:gag/pol protein [Cucumis melo var. makuwa]